MIAALVSVILVTYGIWHAVGPIRYLAWNQRTADSRAHAYGASAAAQLGVRYDCED